MGRSGLQKIIFFSNLLGLAAMWIFRSSTGDEGIGYLACAFLFFELFRGLFAEGMASCAGRMMRSRFGKGQTENALQVFRMMRIAGPAQGLVGAVFLGASVFFLFRGAAHLSRGFLLGWMLSPAFFLIGVEQALQCYCEGRKAERAAAIAHVIRQASFLIFGFLFLHLMEGYGEKVSALVRVDDYVAIYACMGVCLGYLASHLLAVLFLLIVALLSSRSPLEGGEYIRNKERKLPLYYGLCRQRTPMAASSVLAVLPYLPALFLVPVMTGNTSSLLLSGRYGVYASCCLLLPMILGNILGMSVSLVREKCSFSIRREEFRYVKSLYRTGFHISALYGIFGLTYLAALSGPIGELLLPGEGKSLQSIIICGAGAFALAAMNRWMFDTLQDFDHVPAWILSQLLGTVSFAVACLLIAGKVKDPAQLLALSSLISQGVMFLTMFLILTFRQGMNVDLLWAVLLPLCCGCVLGLVQMGIASLIAPHLGNGFTVAVTFFGMAFLYLCLLLVLRNLSDREIHVLPTGKYLERLGQLLHVL
ncbi:MAG: hypothetical protein K5891_03815 [Lachnospiraceae bacterium]|nr:hypothetical protein [Lachnospiraceae bacterium]